MANIGYADDRMIQTCIGGMKLEYPMYGLTPGLYEFDWRFYEEDGKVISAEPCVYIFKDEEELCSFVNPRFEAEGWHSIGEALSDAHQFITEGHMAKTLKGGLQ